MFDQSTKGSDSLDQVAADRADDVGRARRSPTPSGSTSSARSEKPIVAKERTPGKYRDTPVDVKLVLSALWIAMLFVFAYVDILGFLRADVLRAALNGKVATTSVVVNQTFLTFTLIYILVPALMVLLSLLLKPRVNRTTNLVVSVLYMISIGVTSVGEHWTYYILGSVVEVVLLAAIARSSWKWPPPQIAPSMPSATTALPRTGKGS